MRYVLILTLFLFGFNLAPQAQSNSALLDCMQDVNAEWSTQDFDPSLLTDEATPSSEVDKVGTHLRLVTQILNARDTDHLTQSQRSKRQHHLSVLEEYYLNGVFPINLYHEKRTPYFIDHLDTPCAVGHLIIESGDQDLAKEISSLNNYGYIHDLVTEFPEIRSWAHENGFTVDELAWIQPGYSICKHNCNLCLRVVSSYDCSGPCTVFWPNTGDTTWEITGVCPGTTQICIITDANGIQVDPSYMTIHIDYFESYYGTNEVNIPEGISLDLEGEVTDVEFFCDGVISLDLGELFLNNVLFQWDHLDTPTPSPVLEDVCEGTNTVTIMKDFFLGPCSFTKSFEVTAPGCTGDINQNGTVDAADLVALLSDFGCFDYCPSDLNEDGFTYTNDLVILLGRFGTDCN